MRAVALDPNASSSHDYLRTPEIVEDIAIEADPVLGIDLTARFSTAAVPCLVKFPRPPAAARSKPRSFTG